MALFGFKGEGAFKVPTVANDPATLEDGFIWYNTTTDQLKARVNGATVVIA